MDRDYNNDVSSCDVDVISDVKSTQKSKTKVFNVTNVFYIDRIRTEDFAVPPFFKRHLRNVLFQQGKAVRFECTIGGYPTPNVEWYKELEQIVDTSHELSLDECVGYKYYETKEKDLLILDITNVSSEDFGSYTCKLKNIVGEARSTATLCSLSESEEPELLSKQSEKDKKKVLLEETITVIEKRRLSNAGNKMQHSEDNHTTEKKETSQERILTVMFNVPETCKTEDMKVTSSSRKYENELTSEPSLEKKTEAGDEQSNTMKETNIFIDPDLEKCQDIIQSPTGSELRNIEEWIKCGESSDSNYRMNPIPYSIPKCLTDDAENSEQSDLILTFREFSMEGSDNKNEWTTSWTKRSDCDETENKEESRDTAKGTSFSKFKRDVFQFDESDNITEDRSELSDVFEDEPAQDKSESITPSLLRKNSTGFDFDKVNENYQESELSQSAILIREERVQNQMTDTGKYVEVPRLVEDLGCAAPPTQESGNTDDYVAVTNPIENLKCVAPATQASAYISYLPGQDEEYEPPAPVCSSDDNLTRNLKIEEDAEKQMDELISKLIEFSQRNYVLVSSLKVGRSNEGRNQARHQDEIVFEEMMERVASNEATAPSTGNEFDNPPMHPADFHFDSEADVESKKPEFVIPLEDMEVSSDENVVLNISVTGFPAPRITWFKNGHLLSEEDSGVFHDNLKRNSAIYTCIATNQSGEAKSSAVVTIVQSPKQEVSGKNEAEETICEQEHSGQNEGANFVKMRLKRTTADITEKRRSQIISASLVDYLRSKAKSFRQQTRHNHDVVDAARKSPLVNISDGVTRLTHDDVTLRHGSMLSLTSISTTSFESADETLESDAVWEDVASTFEEDFMSTEELIFPSDDLIKSHKESLQLLKIHNQRDTLRESDDELFNPRPLTPTPITVKPPFIYEVADNSGHDRRPFTRQPTEPFIYLSTSDDMETARSENTTPVPPSDKDNMVPTFLVPLNDAVVSRGKTCVLSCCVDGHPVPEVTWQRNGIKILPPESNENASFRPFLTSFPSANTPGQRFKISSERKEMRRNGHSTEYLQHTLTITDCKITDTGEYSVSAVNDHGSVIKRAKIIVKEESEIESTEILFPHFVTKISDSDGMLGGEAVINFQLVGRPEPKVVIFHNLEEVDEDKFMLKKIDNDGNYTITVRNLTLDDEGEVRIHAANDTGCVECSAELFVDERAATPTPDKFGFIQWPDHPDDGDLGMLHIREQLAMQVIAPFFDVITDDVTTTTGSDATFAVRVLAWPAPEVLWYKHGEAVTSGPRYRMESPDFGTHALTIVGVTGSDAGIYTCVVKNDAGEISCKAELIISREKRQSESSEEDDQREVMKKRLKDEYVICRELENGSFSLIRLVKNKKTEVDYAAKYIRRPKSQSRETLLEEIEILKNLSHPNVVSYKDDFETRKHIILLMQYVDMEWFEYLLPKDVVYECEIAEQICQVCNGLSYLHNRDIPIVHLDMKPENIMVTKDGRSMKIIDFGSAKELKNEQEMKWDFGNPEFVSPEVVTSQPVTVACDMWSLGVITYVAISGVSPLLGESDFATVLQVKDCKWQFDSRMFESVSNEAKNFIQNLMVLDPNKRMSAEKAISHSWITQKDTVEKPYPLPNGKLKYFLLRRKWQRSLVTPKTSLMIRSISSLLKREYDSASITVSRVLVSDYVSSSTVTESDDDIDDITSESSPTSPRFRSHHQRHDRKKTRLDKTSISIEDTIDFDKENGSQQASGKTSKEERTELSEANNETSEKPLSLHPINPYTRLQMIGKKVSFEDEQVNPVFLEESVKLETMEQLESAPPVIVTAIASEEEIMLPAAQMPEVEAPIISSGPPGVTLDRPQSVSKLLKEDRRKIKPSRGRDTENVSTKDKIKKKLSSIALHRRHRSFDYQITLSSSDDEEECAQSKKNKSKLSIFTRRKRSAFKGNSLDLSTVPSKENKSDKGEEKRESPQPLQSPIYIKGILKRGGSSDASAQSDPHLQKSLETPRVPSAQLIGANLESIFGPKSRRRRPLVKGASLDLDMVAEGSADPSLMPTRKPRLSAYERRKLQMRRGSSAESALLPPPRVSGLRGPLLEKETAEDEPTAGMSLRRSLTGLKNDSPNHGRSSSTPVELQYPVFEKGKFSPLALSPRAPLTSPLHKYSSLSRSFFSQSMDMNAKPLQETIPEDRLGGKKSLSAQLPTTNITQLPRSRSSDRNMGRKTRSAEKRIPGESYAPYLKTPLVDHGLTENQSTVTLSCLIDAYPFPEIVWYKDNEELLASDRIEIISEPSITKFQLKIRNLLLPDDYGQYQCEVTNSVGTIKTSCTLTPAVVPDKPSAPEFAGTDGKHVWVTWNPPKNCAAAPMAYMLQYREMAAMQWVTVNESLKDTLYKVEKLRSTTSYRFRVRAMNNAGIGPFSKVSQRIQLNQSAKMESLQYAF